MAPVDITNCVRRPAPPKQITPTAPRRAVPKAPADDCAVVTPDGNAYDAWRGDPATHLPEEVFHLVLALAGGRACVGAASVRRAWRHATALRSVSTSHLMYQIACGTTSVIERSRACVRGQLRRSVAGVVAAAPARRAVGGTSVWVGALAVSNTLTVAGTPSQPQPLFV